MGAVGIWGWHSPNPQRSPHTIPWIPGGAMALFCPCPLLLLPRTNPRLLFPSFSLFLFPKIHVWGTPEPFPSPLGLWWWLFPLLGSGFGVIIPLNLSTIPLNLSTITQMCWNQPVLQLSISIPCFSGFSKAYLWISVWWVKKSPLWSLGENLEVKSPLLPKFQHFWIQTKAQNQRNSSLNLPFNNWDFPAAFQITRVLLEMLKIKLKKICFPNKFHDFYSFLISLWLPSPNRALG